MAKNVKASEAPVEANVEAPVEAKAQEARATLTTEDVAAACGMTPKALRRWLREQAKAHGADTPGKGGRYGFAPEDAQAIIAAAARREAKARDTRASSSIAAALRGQEDAPQA